MIISLLTPSRGRPKSFHEMVESAYSTASHPAGIEVVARLDDDDPERASYQPFVPVLVGPRTTLSSYWNECAAQASGEILMQCADDIRFRTYGWDELVIEAFEDYADHIVYVYGRDGIADQRMATHGFMHRRWYEALGYFTWPEFSSDYGDLWNHTIAERLDRLHYIEEVYTEHLHPAVDKGPMDQTHRERLQRDQGGVNEQIWAEAQPSLNQAVAVLAGLLQTPLPTGQ